MRMPMLVLPLVAVAVAVTGPLQAQGAPPAESAPAPTSSLTSYALETQVTVQNALDRGRFAFAAGRIAELDRTGAWRPELGAAVTTLFGRWALDGVALGPRLTFSHVVPISFILGPRERQLLLGVTALADGTWRFAGLEANRGTRIEPAVRGEIAYRFRGERSSSYVITRIAIEGRRWVSGPIVYLALGVERPRRAP